MQKYIGRGIGTIKRQFILRKMRNQLKMRYQTFNSRLPTEKQKLDFTQIYRFSHQYAIK